MRCVPVGIQRRSIPVTLCTSKADGGSPSKFKPYSSFTQKATYLAIATHQRGSPME